MSTPKRVLLAIAAEFEARALAAAAVARHDAEVARLFRELAASSTTPAADDNFTSKNLPAGMARRTFVARCRRLREAGDVRTWREGRIWVAQRDVFVNAPGASSRRARPVLSSAPWTPEGSLGRIGARAVGRRAC